jgi:hypothetical protein
MTARWLVLVQSRPVIFLPLAFGLLLAFVPPLFSYLSSSVTGGGIGIVLAFTLFGALLGLSIPSHSPGQAIVKALTGAISWGLALPLWLLFMEWFIRAIA